MYEGTKEAQQALSPEAALDLLKRGNDRFCNNLHRNRDLLEEVHARSTGQYPFATILSCMDSRAPAELIFDRGIGDIFNIRIAGNILNDDILGSMEFGTKVVGSKIILVLGHTSCGAIKGACDHAELGHLTQLVQKIVPAMERETTNQTERNGQNLDFVNKVSELNVRLVMDQIIKQSPIIAELVDEGSIKIYGGMYDVTSGAVSFLEESIHA
ncbi:carbonic anhydrase family protein [Nibrella viscosa]|uniref:Carbonic anhydrase family protein n=1 Tax=Nibrella viscosa TaxID=1084524 RepID=A0ABP8KTC8_9BACT